MGAPGIPRHSPGLERVENRISGRIDDAPAGNLIPVGNAAASADRAPAPNPWVTEQSRVLVFIDDQTPGRARRIRAGRQRAGPRLRFECVNFRPSELGWRRLLVTHESSRWPRLFCVSAPGAMVMKGGR